MTPDTIFRGMQFFEYFLAHLKLHPTLEIRIITYLIKIPKKGTVTYDLLTELNNHRTTTIYVGITSYVSRRAIEREIKGLRKTFGRISFELVENEHRKVYYIFDRLKGTSRAWLGSQNLCETHTSNIIAEVPRESLDQLRSHLQNLNIKYS